MKPLLKYTIKTADAAKMMKKFGTKKHRDAGYSFEVLDFDLDTKQRVQEPDRYMYKNYRDMSDLVKLNIYYEKPNGQENSEAAKRDDADGGVQDLQGAGGVRGPAD